MSGSKRKILRLALFDGIGLLGMGGASLLVALLWRDATGGLVGIALVTLGGIELRGRWLLQRGTARATGWLVCSQLALLAVVLVYCLRCLQHPPVLALEHFPGLLGGVFAQVSMAEMETLLPVMMRVAYLLVMLLSVIYQGAMALFYLRQTPRALQEPPPLPGAA